MRNDAEDHVVLRPVPEPQAIVQYTRSYMQRLGVVDDPVVRYMLRHLEEDAQACHIGALVIPWIRL